MPGDSTASEQHLESSEGLALGDDSEPNCDSASREVMNAAKARLSSPVAKMESLETSFSCAAYGRDKSAEPQHNSAARMTHAAGQKKPGRDGSRREFESVSFRN
jgi:hypothetical protein